MLGALIGLTLWGSAGATCPEPVGLDDMTSRSVAIGEALESGRNLTARDEARRLRDDVACLDERLPDPATAAGIARMIGAGYVAGGEIALGKPWLRTAHDIEPYTWSLAPDHQVVEVWQGLATEPEAVEEEGGDDFVASAWLDGAPIESPRARAERPHILQIGDDPTDTRVIYGANFPNDVLGPAARPPRSDRSERTSRREERLARAEAASTPPVRSGPLVATRLRPPEKTPLLLSGVGLVVLSGGLYALAAQRRGRFDDPAAASSYDELNQLRTQVNGLVIASAATFALGAGSTTWGGLVDARGTATIRLRF